MSVQDSDAVMDESDGNSTIIYSCYISIIILITLFYSLEPPAETSYSLRGDLERVQPSGSIGDFCVEDPAPNSPPSSDFLAGECPVCIELRQTAHDLDLPHGRTIRDHLNG
jgi:hypothetical protein